MAINLHDEFLSTIDDLLLAFPRFNRPSQARMYHNGQPLRLNRTRQALVPDLGSHPFHCDSWVPCSKSPLSVRPTGGGPESWIALDEDGSGTLAVRPPVDRGAINYASGQLDIQFKESQPLQASYEAVYYPDAYLDFRHLVFFPATSPYLFNFRLPQDYDTRKPAGKLNIGQSSAALQPDAAAYLRAEKLGPVNGLLMQALVHCVGRNNGYYPGVLIFTARDVDNYSGIWDLLGARGGKSFGNGVFVSQRDFQPQYFRALVLHEMSHSFYFHHAPGGGTSGAKPELHDRGDVA